MANPFLCPPKLQPDTKKGLSEQLSEYIPGPFEAGYGNKEHELIYYV